MSEKLANASYQSIVKQQSQKLQDLANQMLDSNDANYTILDKIYNKIEKLQLQQKTQKLQQNKVRDEDRYLKLEQIEKIYRDNGGTETTAYARGIEGDFVGLEGYFEQFKKESEGSKVETSKVVFVEQDAHWLTVRLEKTPDGPFTYQVAESMPETTKAKQVEDLQAEINNVLDDATIKQEEKEVLIQALIASVDDMKLNREERIDNLLGNSCTKIPFRSEKQHNGYDCGICCALNAVDMKPNIVEGHKYFNAKATYSKHDIDGIREKSENAQTSQKTQPQQSINKSINESFVGLSYDGPQEYKDIKKQPPQSTRLSTASTSSSISNEYRPQSALSAVKVGSPKSILKRQSGLNEQEVPKKRVSFSHNINRSAGGFNIV